MRLLSVIKCMEDELKYETEDESEEEETESVASGSCEKHYK